jgi:hypothetical protein
VLEEMCRTQLHMLEGVESKLGLLEVPEVPEVM